MVTDRLIGHDLARYHIEAVLGRGGMGVVYRATDTRLGRTVALKVLSDDRSSDQDFRDRFIRESRLLASIDHPNIVPIYEADEADGQLYIAMRYVPGPELRVIIADEAPMDAAKTVAIISQVADALDAAHAAGLVHRDVKPGNILVMPGATSNLAGHAYLTDFGLTKSTGSDTGLTKIGQFVGTPGYVAPEQIEGRGVDHRVDIYALGCILYNCLSGDVPYPRDSTVASLWAHLKEPPPRLSEHRKGLPKGLDAVITRALAKSPDDRYQTCGALAHAARTAIEPARRVRRAAVAGAVAGAAGAAAGAGDAAGAEPGAAAATAIDSTPVLPDPTIIDPTAADVPAVAPSTVLESTSAVDVPPTVIAPTPDALPAGIAAATVIEPLEADAAGPIPAAATVVESGESLPLVAPAEATPVPATVIESRDAMALGASAMPSASDVDESPAVVPVALAAATNPGRGQMPDPDAATQTVAVPPAKPHVGSALSGRERPLAAVLVAALLIGVGVFGFNAVTGGDSGGASPSPTSSTAAVTTADPGTYVAKAGDTIDSIAVKLGVTIEELRAANPGLTGLIVAGEVIVIPRDDQSTETSSTPPADSPSPSVQTSATASASAATTPSDPPRTATPKPPKPPTPEPRPATPKPDTTPPSNPSITVAGGAGTVFSTKVKLALKAGGASEMRFGNVKGGSCDWGGWRDYKTSHSDWPLVGGSGGKRTVCVQFRDAAGNTSGDRDSTYYDRKPTATATTWCPVYNNVNSTFDVLRSSTANDPDGDDLKISSFGQPTNGGGSLTKTTYQGKDALRFNPSSGFTGYSQFTLTVADDHGGKSNQVTHWIKVFSPIDQTGCP